MRRRDFVKAIASSSVAWPLAARAQQTDQIRRVGVLMNVAPEHPEGQPFVAAFRQALQRLGWIEGRNIRIDIRWGENDVEPIVDMQLIWSPSHLMSSSPLAHSA
jgi:putative ABC transport system substrate-binding protein